ncbi:MAG: hypothetical protein IK143_06440 [Bacteroidales bacterium]|nr:hypothetical protein [Bacteroidales bacterium]
MFHLILVGRPTGSIYGEERKAVLLRNTSHHYEGLICCSSNNGIDTMLLYNSTRAFIVLTSNYLERIHLILAVGILTRINTNYIEAHLVGSTDDGLLQFSATEYQNSFLTVFH